MNLKKRFKLAALTAAGLAANFSVAAQQDKPNVIFILADDLGINDLGCYGQDKIKTPAIDNLAAHGIRFTQHYAGCTISAPSRGSLLTGRHTGHSYIRGNKSTQCDDGRNYDYPLADEEVTLGEVFKGQGYSTACVGKWGLGGPGSEGSPVRQGFDYFYGYLGQSHAHRYYPGFLHENETLVELDGKTQYAHDLIAEKALDFITNNADKPFFLFFTPTIPHAELKVPDDDCGDYVFEEVPFEGNSSYSAQERPRATYAAMVSRLDYNVQQIVDLLEEKGISDNTMIVFSSDNGVHKEGGHTPDFFDSNGIYRGYKRDLYEGGLRTPLVIYWPSKVKSASVNATPSAFWDFMPTICEMIGADCPETDGVSMLPAIEGRGEQPSHDYFYWEFHEQGGKRAVLKDGWKLIELKSNTLAPEYELYNIEEDPGEKSNKVTAQEHAPLVEELKKILLNERTDSKVWNFATEQIVVDDAEPLPAIISASASSTQPNQGIAKSYDGNSSTLYHSKYDEKGVTVTLTYNFDPAIVKTIVYTTRLDGNTNGNFKKFGLYALPQGSDEYVKIGDYDFNGEAGSHRVDIDAVEPELSKIRSLQFVVEPGAGNMVSCAEMQFYKPKARILEFEGLKNIEIKDAVASSVQADKVIQNSYDRDFSTNYHSVFKASGGTQFPVVLDYFFEPNDLKKIMYFTRRTERNGNFGKFDVLVSQDGSTYTKIGSYDFNKAAGEYLIELDDAQQKLAEKSKSVRFNVKTGHNDMVSCSEMAFYGKDNTTLSEKISGESTLFRIEGNRIVAVDDSARLSVYPVNGVEVGLDVPLLPGIYIVKSPNAEYKVCINSF